MARTVRNFKLDTRSARAKLSERREPYWTVISRGCALGYRRGAKGGTWIARFRSQAGKQLYKAVGATDDARDADGLTAFSFAQAQARAREFFLETARILAGENAPDCQPYTVARCLADYFEDREQRGSKGLRADRYAANARIIPHLGNIEIAKLTAARIKAWRQLIETSPKIVRAGKEAVGAESVVGETDCEARRARRATSNRILTVLKAALNYAFSQEKIASDQAWRQVRPNREVDAPAIRFLVRSECLRLVNAAAHPFRDLVRGALVTGARYGELCRMKAGDFDAFSGSLSIRQSKSGRPRRIALNAEGTELFKHLTAGRGSQERIFIRADGKPWGPSHQQRLIAEASRRATIEPSANFHCLRHTYASTLAMEGVSMRVIAEQLGHADTRVTERHYAHLSSNYVSRIVRENLPDLGIWTPQNIETFPLRN